MLILPCRQKTFIGIGFLLFVNGKFIKFKVLLLLDFHKSLSMIGYIIEVNRSNLQNFKFCEFDHSKPCH